MTLNELLKNLSLEDINFLKKEKLKQDGLIPSFKFSKISESDLDNILNIEQKFTENKFDFWFNSEIKISKEILEFLKSLIKKNRDLIYSFNEEDLKIHFLSPLFFKIDFKSFEKEFRDFYNEQIIYKTDKFIFNGEVDFVLAKGLKRSKTPYFFIQEFKRGKKNSDPEPQLLAELIAGLEISNLSEIKGAFIIGAIWNFVILEKLGKDSYRYFVSENFDSTKIDDLTKIYKNLVFIKHQIEQI